MIYERINGSFKDDLDRFVYFSKNGKFFKIKEDPWSNVQPIEITEKEYKNIVAQSCNTGGKMKRKTYSPTIRELVTLYHLHLTGSMKSQIKIIQENLESLNNRIEELNNSIEEKGCYSKEDIDIWEEAIKKRKTKEAK